jgi:hypothetical protein
MVAVVNVRRVRMPVLERRMVVKVRVRFAGRVPQQVRVLMMLVVHVTVVVFQRLVHVQVSVPFTDQKADADEHHQRRAPEIRSARPTRLRSQGRQ